MGVGASLQVVVCWIEVVASYRLEPTKNQWWKGVGACICITTIIRGGFLSYGFPLNLLSMWLMIMCWCDVLICLITCSTHIKFVDSLCIKLLMNWRCNWVEWKEFLNVHERIKLIQPPSQFNYGFINWYQSQFLMYQFNNWKEILGPQDGWPRRILNK